MMLLVVAALAALQAAPAEFPPRGTPSEAQFAHARRELNERLFDYPSARFRDVRGDDTRICGYVNAKNRMGAYTGWKLFGVLGSEGSLVWIGDDYMLEPMCTPALMSSPTDRTARMEGGQGRP